MGLRPTPALGGLWNRSCLHRTPFNFAQQIMALALQERRIGRADLEPRWLGWSMPAFAAMARGHLDDIVEKVSQGIVFDGSFRG